VIEHARAYNADPARLLTVTEILVFGSYLDPAVDPLGDLDLAVSTVRCGLCLILVKMKTMSLTA